MRKVGKAVRKSLNENSGIDFDKYINYAKTDEYCKDFFDLEGCQSAEEMFDKKSEHLESHLREYPSSIKHFKDWTIWGDIARTGILYRLTADEVADHFNEELRETIKKAYDYEISDMDDEMYREMMTRAEEDMSDMGFSYEDD